jgi:hypothetical protein
MDVLKRIGAPLKIVVPGDSDFALDLLQWDGDTANNEDLSLFSSIPYTLQFKDFSDAELLKILTDKIAKKYGVDTYTGKAKMEIVAEPPETPDLYLRIVNLYPSRRPYRRTNKTKSRAILPLGFRGGVLSSSRPVPYAKSQRYTERRVQS